ncbi:phosphatase PAP2 family protein [Gordonia hankookensis]|uniref:Phosphatase PAP2 family protein n=1 Tax=Gordonia hankookensis TaxID=589403 RepID=A0ABR7WF80_9ACTN|nr:phosphatase PAP2 family protein [Gordonia hankookensis]MBD1321427.1 phosphatase PAP2 family protein [Gordonia hankookensis]
MFLSPNGVDRTITDAVVDLRTEVLTDIALVATATGNTLVLTTVVVVVVLGLVGIRAFPEAILVGAGSFAGYLLMVGLKHLFARPRPPIADRLLDIDTYSFPSGHAMMSTVVFGLLAVAAYRLSAWVRAHPAVLLIAPIWAIAIGCSRVYLGVHWTTDVLAGWLIGAAWVAGCAWLCARWAATPQRQRTAGRPEP